MNRSDTLRALEQFAALLPKAGAPARVGRWEMLVGAVEVLAALGEHAEAGRLYPQMLDAIERAGLFLPWSAVLLERIAGVAAASAGKLAEAEAHYRRALEQAHSLPFRKEQPEVRHWYARMLLDRDGGGDHAKACTLLSDAAEDYSVLGMPRHSQMARALLRRAK